MTSGFSYCVPGSNRYLNPNSMSDTVSVEEFEKMTVEEKAAYSSFNSRRIKKLYPGRPETISYKIKGALIKTCEGFLFFLAIIFKPPLNEALTPIILRKYDEQTFQDCLMLKEIIKGEVSLIAERAFRSLKNFIFGECYVS
jgi:hypothetical protein